MLGDGTITAYRASACQEYKAEDLIEDQTLLKRRREREAEEARQREEAAARR